MLPSPKKDSFQKIYHKKLKRLELQESRSPHSKSKSSPKSRRTHQKNLNEFYFENDNDSYSDDNYDDIYKYVKKESNRDPNKGYPLFPGKDGHKKRGINEKEGNFSKRKRSNQFNEDFDLNMQSDDERNVNFRKRSNKNTKHLDLNNQSFDGKTNFKKGSNHRNNKFDLYNQSFDDDNIHSRKDFNQLNGRFDLNNQSFNGKTRSNPYSENFDPNNNSNAWNDGYDRNDKLIKKFTSEDLRSEKRGKDIEIILKVNSSLSDEILKTRISIPTIIFKGKDLIFLHQYKILILFY